MWIHDSLLSQGSSLITLCNYSGAHTCLLMCLHAQLLTVSDSLWPRGLYLTRLCPWNFPSNNTREGCHFPLQGNLPNPGMESESPMFPALAGRFFIIVPPGKPILVLMLSQIWSMGAPQSWLQFIPFLHWVIYHCGEYTKTISAFYCQSPLGCSYTHICMSNCHHMNSCACLLWTHMFQDRAKPKNSDSEDMGITFLDHNYFDHNYLNITFLIITIH